MLIGVVLESDEEETRVAATPSTTAQLLALGYEVVIEPGAGLSSRFPDAAYTAAGASTGPRDQVWAADIVMKVNPPTAEELARLRDGAILIAWLSPGLDPGLVSALAARPITALALDAVPRLSRAQSMDVLSSTANIAGYRAVVEAANEFGRFFTGQVTAAGKVPPAKVLVVGAGVAGLAAIGAASSLGAVVRATDPRPEAAGQVESIGGTYLPVVVEEQSQQSADGYAVATSELYNAAAARLYSEQAAEVDIIITTANIPGRAAPKIISAADVAAMRSGSVIVDLAAGNGGNVEGTVPGKRIVTANGVTILGYTNLARRLPTQASQLFGTNLVNLMKLLTPGRDGQVVLDLDDVIQRGITVVRDGELLWPPPPVPVSAAPVAAAPAVVVRPVRRPLGPTARLGLVLAGVALLWLVNALAPAPIPQHFTVLTLSVVIGYYVIGKVHHALHTPLMSVTNAISGVIVVGALLQVAQADATVRALAAVAILLASINIVGGFAVTRRMLAMFSR